MRIRHNRRSLSVTSRGVDLRAAQLLKLEDGNEASHSTSSLLSPPLPNPHLYRDQQKFDAPYNRGAM